jgi:hypothetical protein
MLALWQEFLAWFWPTAAWLNTRDNWAILVGVFGLGLLYFAFKKRG